MPLKNKSNALMNHLGFYNKLKESLPKSNATDRQQWAKNILEQKINLKDLSKLLFSEKEVASRFLWLLSDIGTLNPKILNDFLPYLLTVKDQINYSKLEASFANFWILAGVPFENEAEAISLLFNWVLSPQLNVTSKSRSFLVLFNLVKSYPDLKNELRISLEDQMDKHTDDFKRKSQKLLNKLASI